MLLIALNAIVFISSYGVFCDPVIVDLAFKIKF